MGFSDIGPCVSEINTPDLVRRAVTGVKFSHFYNCVKCGPTKNAGTRWPRMEFSGAANQLARMGFIRRRSKDFEDLCVATYAAMMDSGDQGVGGIVQTVDELKQRDNTPVNFHNDDGDSHNDLERRGDFGTPKNQWNTSLGWAHASSTPFKFYKRSLCSVGVATPCIADWPAVIKPRAGYEDQPCQVTDLIPTLMVIAGISYPDDFKGMKHPPLPDRSFTPIDNGWKIATSYSQPWQLYDLTKDRTETRREFPRREK